ncbi:uncharacterized protein MELLADRAFT_76846 [Melampsora larici-populina 98AG31]|uniref:Magnesium transporter n=1 Tax=Melampsora larici-populina (strain 98AG31 / pathotype 3-4-7) TaxID=747676 RepID=F4RAL4_MELLP|nr:uncharacterized protein MELLADRAFT_76846 [Melampsora larici-populina 98AG31]EGG10500.1 hypothetical protein MELLADRAFT_76846 [Melampsora larici-populina 98AG31]
MSQSDDPNENSLLQEPNHQPILNYGATSDRRVPSLSAVGQPLHADGDHYRSNRSSTDPTASTVKQRFKAAAHVVSAAQRIVSGSSSTTNHQIPTQRIQSSSLRYQWNSIGSMEPGVNANQPQPQLSHLLKTSVSVDLVDYSEDQVNFLKFRPDCQQELDRLKHSLHRSRPSWSRVRWINVNGLNWDVIKLLALQYQLHPLAVEDCVHTSARSKSEYYKHHLFVHAAVHTLVDDQSDGSSNRINTTNSSTKVDTDDPLENGNLIDPDQDPSNVDNLNEPHHLSGKRPAPMAMMDLGTVTGGLSMAGKEVFDAEREVVRRLTSEYKLRIHAEKLSIFLLRGGTLITIFSHDGSRTVVPLLDRLRSSDTLLRSTSDASMLLQAVLDLIVDQALDVVEAFRSRLTSLEAAVLVNPKLDTVRHLHVLSGELLLLKRTLTPLSSLVHRIRNHDPSDERITGRSKPVRGSSASNLDDPTFITNSSSSNSTGFISPQARVYLSDVLDHIDSLLSSLELFSGWASNLVDFTFNTMSFSTNESMKQLSIVTIIFLPLTFLTGYFGMNFVEFGAIQGSDLFFWKLACPITFLLVLMFTYSKVLRSLVLQKNTLRMKNC